MAFEEKVSVLCEKMEEETKRCRELLDLSREEQDYMMHNDIESLARNTERMKGIVESLKKSQGERRNLMQEIGRELGCKPDRLSLARILKGLSPELSTQLRERNRDLVQTGERLYRANHNTMFLINFSLDLLSQQSRLWAQLLSEEEGYHERGARAPAAACPLFVQEKV